MVEPIYSATSQSYAACTLLSMFESRLAWQALERRKWFTTRSGWPVVHSAVSAS